MAPLSHRGVQNEWRFILAKGKFKRRRLRQQRKETSIHAAGLSERVSRILAAHGISTLYDLDTVSDDTLKAMPRIGEKAIKEIHAVQVHIPTEKEYSENAKERK